MISKKQKEDILGHGIEDISSDITNLTDLKHRLNHVEWPTGNLECLPLKDFCALITCIYLYVLF